ncbi:MAG TPA: hypothetical protein VHQ86_02375 [Candidatus Saccharimonadia bacterium]|jgi:hypothetical protein|nr:hypothetical protein [Candidatus Saccharimonadia bacterium]
MKDFNPKHDNFLADAVHTKQRHLGYMDGFRFGFGFFVAGLVIALILAGLAWAIMVVFKLG